MGILNSIIPALGAAMLIAGGVAHAQQTWKVEELADHGEYRRATVETRRAAPSQAPDMLMAEGPSSGGILAAGYAQPTSRYRHGVLGDTLEGGMLVVRLATGGQELRYRLPETEVFEDIAPRIADLDGDGQSEIVTILSSLYGGASVTVFGVDGNAIGRRASTGFIGRPNRWLNIAGIANFSGGRVPGIAIVATPHIGGNLGIFRYTGGKLIQIAGAPGFSNHVIGSRELRLSAVADVNNDGKADLALPSADRRSLLIMGLTGGGLRKLGEAKLPAAIDKAIGVKGRGSNTVFLVGTENGKYYAVSANKDG